MVYTVNVFRVLGDVSHALSKAILIWAIHWNKSAEGLSISLKMQNIQMLRRPLQISRRFSHYADPLHFRVRY